MAQDCFADASPDGVSDTLRRELLPYGIDVILIRPGAVKTEIWGKAAGPGVEAYAHTDYVEPLADFEEYDMNLAKGGYSSEGFGKRVADTFEARRPKTR